MNIFWIVVDSICNYERNDLHSLLSTFKKLRENNEGFYFEDTISQFPSTNLSLLSFLTGRFPYYILLDFYKLVNNLPGLIDKNGITLLKKANYRIQSILFGNEQVNITKDILNPYYREDLFQGDHWLDAKEVFHLYNQLINEILPKENNLLFIFFRPGDPQTDSYLSKIIDDLKIRNLWKDSIIIINSDHGYYDKNLYRKRKLLHFDDLHQSSIQPALFIKIPSMISNLKPRTITKRVYLIDVLETILDFLDIEVNYERESISFRELIEEDIDINKNRKIRADCYLMFQSLKKTSIIKDNWKLYNNNGKFALYDLDNDKLEKKDIKEQNPKIYRELYRFYLKSESRAYKISKSHLNILYDQSILPTFESENFFIPFQFPPYLIKYLKDKLKIKNNVLNSSDINFSRLDRTKNLVTILIFNRLTGYGIKKLVRKYKKYTKRFIILNTKLSDVSYQINKTGYLKFVLRSIFDRRGQLFQRWNEILIWILYFPLYFIKHMRKYYN